jgi:hypothetical protein
LLLDGTGVTDEAAAKAIIAEYNNGKNKESVPAQAKEVLDRFSKASEAFEKGDIAAFAKHLRNDLTDELKELIEHGDSESQFKHLVDKAVAAHKIIRHH